MAHGGRTSTRTRQPPDIRSRRRRNRRTCDDRRTSPSKRPSTSARGMRGHRGWYRSRNVCPHAATTPDTDAQKDRPVVLADFGVCASRRRKISLREPLRAGHQKEYYTTFIKRIALISTGSRRRAHSPPNTHHLQRGLQRSRLAWLSSVRVHPGAAYLHTTHISSCLVNTR